MRAFVPCHGHAGLALQLLPFAANGRPCQSLPCRLQALYIQLGAPGGGEQQAPAYMRASAEGSARRASAHTGRWPRE